MKLQKFISEKDTQAIEAAVQAAEKLTSGEIVPAIVHASSDYAWVGYRGACLGWLAASLISALAHYLHPFVFAFWSLYLAQAFGLVFGYMLSRSGWALRFVVPAQVFEHEVLEAAQSAFLRFGLTETRDRTGVLVFVSLQEHRVQILADKGIHEKVGEQFWQTEVRKIAESIRGGQPAAGMIAAIESIGRRLAEHFPRSADDRDELPNRLRTE